MFGPNPTQTAAPVAAPTTHGTTLVPLGETLVFTRQGGSVDDEVEYTLTADKTYARAPGSGYLKPRKGVFYAVRATIAVRKGSTYGCACDFALIATDGTVYEPGSGFGFPDALDAATVNTGQKLSGLVVFDIPRGAYAGARVELRPDAFSDGDQGYWTLP